GEWTIVDRDGGERGRVAGHVQHPADLSRCPESRANAGPASFAAPGGAGSAGCRVRRVRKERPVYNTEHGGALMTAPVIVLDPIALGNYRHGAYIIKYAIKGTVPPGARVFLAIGGDRHLLEITGRSKRDVMGADNLPQLLRLIGQVNAWGTPVDCT